MSPNDPKRIMAPVTIFVGFNAPFPSSGLSLPRGRVDRGSEQTCPETTLLLDIAVTPVLSTIAPVPAPLIHFATCYHIVWVVFRAAMFGNSAALAGAANVSTQPSKRASISIAVSSFLTETVELAISATRHYARSAIGGRPDVANGRPV